MQRKYTHNLVLGLITLAGLGLRLLAWHWHEFRPLGGDEREYLDLAIHLAQGKGYYDLLFMRPPLFPLGMAVFVWLFDGDLQMLRLVNVLVSTATIPLVYAWTRVLLPNTARRVGLWAAGITAASYTLALNATELLTETLTLAGLVIVFMLLTLAWREHRWRWVLGAGVTIALVCLIRSVALPLLGVGGLALWFNRDDVRRKPHALMFVLVALLTIAPWTLRNAVQYGGFILIDTTGQENLWLDNDPRGREAVKAELYALGDQRVERGKLASQRGIAAITNNPAWFANKMWHEFQRFWALEHSDDMLARPAIWQPAAETWLRVVLGDGVWLVVLLAGSAGVVLLPIERTLRWICAIWLLYTVFTGMLFHIELRYRLPMLPILLPCAAWFIGARKAPNTQNQNRLAVLLAGVLLGLTLHIGDYARLAPRLAYKHWLLWQAEAALNDPRPLPTSGVLTNDTDVPLFQAQAQAARALQLDPDSVLAQVLLARISLRLGQPDIADQQLLAAIATLPAHPYAHLLRGDRLRSQGDTDAAAREFTYEAASTEDLQRWTRQRFSQTSYTSTLTIGFNDLGFVQGFYLSESRSRWFGTQATIWLAAPETAQTLDLEVAAQRPQGVATPTLAVQINGINAGSFAVSNDWNTLSVLLPANLDRTQPLAITLVASDTFVPHAIDPTNPDGRDLGVRVRLAQIK